MGLRKTVKKQLTAHDDKLTTHDGKLTIHNVNITALLAAIDNLIDDAIVDIATLTTNLAIVDGLLDAPVADVTDNIFMRDVIGNKEDDPSWVVGQNKSIVAYLKAATIAGVMSYSGKCNSGMTDSATTILCDELKGFGDDFFNTDWVMIIAYNDSSHGSAPEGEIRDITDYVTSTGEFTVDAFSTDVSEDDKIVIARRSLFTVDSVAVKTVPVANSLAYLISKFIASGDGDFLGSTPLPSDKSLYDVIVLDRLDHATYGLSAIQAMLAIIDAFHDVPTVDATTDAQMRDVIGRKTDASIYAPSGINSITAYVKGIISRMGTVYGKVPRITSSMDFWSVNDDVITLTTTATDDHALPSIVVAGIPDEVTVIRVVALLKIGLIKDTSTADNAINGATTLGVDADSEYASLVTAINIVDNSWAVDVSEATERGGDVLIGNTDVKAEITGNGTWYGRLENISCDGNNLLLKEVAWGIRVYFTP